MEVQREGEVSLGSLFFLEMNSKVLGCSLQAGIYRELIRNKSSAKSLSMMESRNSCQL